MTLARRLCLLATLCLPLALAPSSHAGEGSSASPSGGGCRCCQPGAEAAAGVWRPLRGVVLEVKAASAALLVKHEEIPGFMKAMTMLLRVEASVLQTVKAGDRISAEIGRVDGSWTLRAVQVLPAAP